jgi:gamma-glutamylcysteine synthetase
MYICYQDFMAGELPQVPGERPTLKDWEIHIGSIYPEVQICISMQIFFSLAIIYDNSMGVFFVG